ncbi:unnamed protein product [Adineta ricciae]|uniref:Testis-expressed sequence 2 protein n=1 Tax=Adineta ricciae TaxID=249248 RepID=A0A813RNU0_ADIRI|nr:unnamed protein product [Adineta ricciae]CAF1095933.1 unnamed protein product [Adineta ricciae]
MSTTNPDQPKKSPSIFLEKLGQRINNFKEDIAENIERRKQSHNNTNNNQVHFTRANLADDALVIERKPSAPIEVRQRLPSSEDVSSCERSSPKSQLLTNVSKKSLNESLSSSIGGMSQSHSFQDIFSSENSEHAKDMILNNVRFELNRRHSQAPSESGSEDSILHRNDPVEPKSTNSEKPKRKSTMLLAGPRFHYHTIESKDDFKQTIIYPVSGIVGAISVIIMLWKPLSPFFSGYFLGFLTASALAYIIIQMYLRTKGGESIPHEWIDFPELENALQDEAIKENKLTSLHTCCEVVFGHYDVDKDQAFTRYPAVIYLDSYRLTIHLPSRTISDEKKDKEMKFVGFREYKIKGAKLILVPGTPLSRIKYWLNEYPIVLQNIEISNKQITNKQFYDKSKYDTDDFFNNSQTTLSLFFETCPEKEDWFHKLSLVLRKDKDDDDHTDNLQTSTPPANTIAHSSSDTQIGIAMPTNTVNLESRVQMKPAETVGPPYPDTSSLENSETEALRSQINETDILSDINQARQGARDALEKDSPVTHRKGSAKKKIRKEEENLYRLLNSSECLDEAAITLNFLTRRLCCDIFEDRFFKDLLKEKIELKLKEIAVSVMEGLRVETIDMGSTFPVILKVHPMQWNTKGIWFNVFVFYRGDFNFTIKTKIALNRLLNYNSIADQPLHYQHRSNDATQNDDECAENRELIPSPKPVAKEPELPENVAARKIDSLLTKVAANKHVQRFASFKPVAGVIEKISKAEIGANIAITNLSGIMTINIPPPPSDRVWVGFAEMPDLNLKVSPVLGESKYSYALIHDFLEARIRDEFKRLLVLPAMDDQLLPFFRDWVDDVINGQLRNQI